MCQLIIVVDVRQFYGLDRINLDPNSLLPHLGALAIGHDCAHRHAADPNVGHDGIEAGCARRRRVGFWRLMRLFQERGLPLTVFGCALERNPAAAAAIRLALGSRLCG
jgi:hypothetical protein